ncbi:MAG: hypothetical protein M1834_009706 [Cirrosporium novae-zelandiae]|nr:MAG: hypothetical protein M1834_009706 [Cirrosporium novae-zelandiae]
MEESQNEEGKTFVLSETSKGSPILVRKNSTRSYHSIHTDMDPTPEGRFSMAASTNASNLSSVSMKAPRRGSSLSSLSGDSIGPTGSMHAVKSPTLESVESMSPPDEIPPRHGNKGKRRPMSEPTSFFEDDSDSDIETHQVVEAQKGQFLKPQMLSHQARSRQKAGKLLGQPLVDFSPPTPTRRQGRVFNSQVPSGPSHSTLSIANRDVPKYIRPLEEGAATPFQSRAGSFVPDAVDPLTGLRIKMSPSVDAPIPIDGLRSHPVRRAASVPMTMRKVRIHPNDIRVNPAPRFEREGVVSTPYVPHFRIVDRDPEDASPTDPLTEDRSEFIVCLYRHGSLPPKVRREYITRNKIFPPTPPRRSSASKEKNKPKFHVPLSKITNRNTPGLPDDEALFRLLSKSYLALRSPTFRLFSARSVSSVSVSHPNFDSTLPIYSTLQTRALSLFQHPKLGHGERDFVYLVYSLSSEKSQSIEEALRPEEGADTQPLTFEISEEFNATRIAFAILLVVVASIIATVLWVTIGVQCTGGVCGMEHQGWRESGGRVETGVLLGALVLGMGWTVVCAWMGLSWLVD